MIIMILSCSCNPVHCRWTQMPLKDTHQPIKMLLILSEIDKRGWLIPL